MLNNSESIFEYLSSRYGEEKAKKLFAYLDMVLERNEHINLTAVRDRDEALIKHVADSLAVCDLPEYRSSETVIDIGTGAGFPGALLAIVSPEKEFVLLDSTLKRLRVIDEFCAALCINNVRTVHARAEEINRKPPHSGAYDLCVSRAVASLDKLCGWCLPFVKSDGFFIAYKGENYSEELKQADKYLRKYKAFLNRVEPYKNVPEEISGHVLMVFSKH
jgi:16S rRNA (guanine527-N7)-methyltransferase